MNLASRIGPVLGALCLTACAPAIRESVEAGVEGSVEALSDPETRADAAEIASSPELLDATRKLSAAAAQGVVEGARAGLSDVRVDGQFDQLMGDTGERAEAVLREDIAPGAAAVVRQSIDTALRTAASDANIERVRAVVTVTTEAAMRGVTSALAEGLQEDLAPLLAAREDGSPSLPAALLDDPQLRQALGAMAHEVSREIVLGSQDALESLQKQEDKGGFFGNLAGLLGIGVGVLIALLAAVSITFIALVVLVFRGASQRKHLERDIRQREQMVMQLMHATLAGRGETTEEQRQAMTDAGLDPGTVQGT